MSRLRLEDFGVAEIQTRGFGEIPCDAAVRRQVGCGLFGSCCAGGIRLAIRNLPVCVPARLEFGITGAGNNVPVVRQVVAGAEQQTQIGPICVVARTILEKGIVAPIGFGNLAAGEIRDVIGGAVQDSAPR